MLHAGSVLVGISARRTSGQWSHTCMFSCPSQSSQNRSPTSLLLAAEPSRSTSIPAPPAQSPPAKAELVTKASTHKRNKRTNATLAAAATEIGPHWTVVSSNAKGVPPQCCCFQPPAERLAEHCGALPVTFVSFSAATALHPPLLLRPEKGMLCSVHLKASMQNVCCTLLVWPTSLRGQVEEHDMPRSR